VKILFLFPYPLEQAPSQRFRFEQYFAALLKQGYSIDSQSFWGEYYWKVLYKKGNTLQKAWGLLNGFGRRFRVLSRASSADIIFIHREVTPVGPPVFEWLIAKVFNKTVVFDFDDAIWLPNTSESNKIAGWLKWHSKTESICRWAWKVSVGNSYLAHYAKQFNDRVVINPTTIETEQHHRITKKIKPNNDPIVIGWTGSHSTLPYLDMLWPALEQLAKDEKFTFRVISNQPPLANYLWLEFIAWNKETEIDDLAAIDIGVMPLTDDKWSKGKCGFKALQYMALEISTVASPVGVNTDIIKDGINGLMATNTEEWVFALKKLIKSTALRTQLSEEGRRTVENTYSVKANTKNFLELFGK